MAVKRCVKCQEEKPLSAFMLNKDKRKTYHYYSQGCKDCFNEAKALLRRLRRGCDSLTMRERFDQYHQPIPWTGCWIWTGGTSTVNGHTHGIFNPEPRGHRIPESAYRTSWRIHRGEIPAGLCVLHRCDNRLCVNPDHLWLGTKKENTHDMIRKDRHPFMKKINGVTYGRQAA